MTHEEQEKKTPAVLTPEETEKGFTINAEGKVVNAQGVVVR